MKVLAKEVYTVRHDVPMPPSIRGGGTGRESKYPFASMEVGSSFVVPGGDDVGRKLRSMTASAYSWGQRQSPKRKFSVRTLRDANEVGVWRIE